MATGRPWCASPGTIPWLLPACWGGLSALAVAAALSGGDGYTVGRTGLTGDGQSGHAMPALLNAAILMSTTTEGFYFPGAGLSAWWAYLSICLATSRVTVMAVGGQA